MREEPSDDVKEYNSHQRKQCTTGQYDKEDRKEVLCRTLYQAELGMDPVCAELRRGVRMTVQNGTDFTAVISVRGRLRVFTA